MAVDYETSSVNSSGSPVSSLVVNKPSGTIDTDLLLAFVVIGADQTVTSAPAGWTLIGSNNTGGSTGDCRHYAYRKIASSEGSTYTWQFSAAVDCAIAILRFDGTHATSPINASASNLNSGSTLTLTAPGITPSVTDTVVVYAFGCNSGVTGNLTFTPQAGLTARAEADPAGSTTNRAAVAVFTEGKSTTAPEGSKTCTISDDAKGVAWAIVLAPAVGGGGGGPTTTITIQTTTQTSTEGGCMLGWYDGNNDVDEALERATELGLPGWAVIRLYNSPTDFPTIKENSTEAIIAAGAIPMVSHKPPHTGNSWIAIHSNQYEAEIDAWVAYYASLAPDQVIFIFHHEPHDNAVDLKPEKGLEGNASDFVKAYRYIGQKFRDAGATNVLLGYSAVAATWANKKASGSSVLGSGDKCWPGDDLVDVLCHDDYNTAGEDDNPNPSYGTITYIGKEQANPAKSVANITIPIPTARRSGDLLLALLHTDYCNLGTNTPAGWTQRLRREEGYGQSGAADPLYGGTDLCGYVYWKISDGTETSVTFTPAEQDDGTQSGNMFTGTVAVFRGVDASSPIYDTGINPQTSGNQISCPSVSHAAGGIVVFFFIEDDEDPITNPSGHSQIANYHGNPNNPDDTVHISYKSYSTAGTTGTQTAQHAGEVGQQSPNDMGMSVSLRPGSGSVYSYGGTSWHSFESEYSETVQLAKTQNKPLIFGEIGSNHSKPEGDRGEWFRDGAAWINNSQDAQDFLKGFCYYHVDNHDDSGHWWRFTGDPDTMFQGDGATGYIQGFVQDAYFKTVPFDVLTDNEVTSTMQGGIPPAVSFGNPAVAFSTAEITTISQAGGIASPADYDILTEEAGVDFGIATLTTPTTLTPTGIASVLAFGTPALTRHAANGYYFEPPIRHFSGGILPDSKGAQRGLFKYYRGAPVGHNVYLMANGTITEAPYDLNAIVTVWHGGHLNVINDEEEVLLRAAGYDAYITARPVGV